jgi:ABC-type phosphate transport system substrate-binding protein
MISGELNRHFIFSVAGLVAAMALLFSQLSLAGPSASLSASTSASSVDFGNPDDSMEMEDSWVNKPVAHEDKAGDADLVVTLGQQTYPALKDFIEDYARTHQLKIVTEPGSCGVTAKKLRRKMVDIGAYCCPPGKTDRLPGVVFHTIGVAPIALVTRPDNPVDNLSLEQAREIFAGKVIRWSEVSSGPGILADLKIQPVARLHCKKRPGHWKGLLENQDLFGPNVHEVGVIPDMITNVAKEQGTIGYETLYMLDVYREQGQLKVLTVDGMNPADLGKMVDASYPVYRTYSLATWADDNHSKQAMALVNAIRQHVETNSKKYGIVPVVKLREAGWKFRGDELVGEPDGDGVISERD